MAKEMKELAAGDCCYLKSGSGKMTVEKIEGELIHVVWIVYGVGTCHKAVIHKDCLVWTNASMG